MNDLDIKAMIDQQTIPLAKNLSTGEYEAIVVSPDTLRAFSLDIDITAMDIAGNYTKEKSTVRVVSIWIAPKTDWTKDDYFNIEDWRRIMGNILYIYDLSIKMYPLYEISEVVGFRNYDDWPRANDFNVLIANLIMIIKNTYLFKYPSIRGFVDNGNFIDFVELNQLENIVLQAYEFLTGQYESLSVLAFTLGGDEFGN